MALLAALPVLSLLRLLHDRALPPLPQEGLMGEPCWLAMVSWECPMLYHGKLCMQCHGHAMIVL